MHYFFKKDQEKLHFGRYLPSQVELLLFAFNVEASRSTQNYRKDKVPLICLVIDIT